MGIFVFKFPKYLRVNTINLQKEISQNLVQIYRCDIFVFCNHTDSSSIIISSVSVLWIIPNVIHSAKYLRVTIICQSRKFAIFIFRELSNSNVFSVPWFIFSDNGFHSILETSWHWSFIPRLLYYVGVFYHNLLYKYFLFLILIMILLIIVIILLVLFVFW